MNGKLQALSQGLRPAGGRVRRAKTPASNTHVLEDISRECTAVGNVLRLRAREQTVETQLRERAYLETTEHFDHLKEICRPPVKKKKSSRRNRKRAAEMLTALTSAPSPPTGLPTVEPVAVREKLTVSATQILARLRRKPSPARLFRRHSFMPNCGSHPDFLPPACCERSARSFMGESGHGVEAS